MAKGKTEKKADPCRVTLKNVVLSFADVWQPKVMESDEDGKENAPKYHANGLMEKGTEQTKENLAKLKTARTEASKLQKKWGADPAKWPKLKPNQLCVRDGDLEEWDGYEGHWYVSASNSDQPLLVDRGRRDTKKADGLLYAGAIVNLTVRLWAQDNKFGKRINASLEAVQFVEHGTPFGHTPVDRNEVFDDLSEDGEVADLDEDNAVEEDDDSPI